MTETPNVDEESKPVAEPPVPLPKPDVYAAFWQARSGLLTAGHETVKHSIDPVEPPAA